MSFVMLRLLEIAFVVRVLLRPHRDPASRVAWIVVIMAVPVLGVVTYILLGETNIGRRRVERKRRVIDDVRNIFDRVAGGAPFPSPEIQQRHAALFKVGKSISYFDPATGNQAELMPDSNSAIDQMVADIDAATDHVHLLFYIWLPDNNGRKMADALKRAAGRGVACRAMVDDLGSRQLIKSDLWKEMGAAGIKLARALPVGNPLLRMFNGRIDLRDHRKILVIDNQITYCGSQNCADPEFLVKAKFAPWVDAVMRFTGPVVRQNQALFATDWMTYVDEDISAILEQPIETTGAGFVAQVVATGPTNRPTAAPEMFAVLMYAARQSLFITTPYYVPVPSLQAAICAAANRGVETTIIFPARNDDFAVGAASRSYYEDLLRAGVRIFEYQAGLLHTKSLTLDGDVTFIGSANMDRRSFDLNYENNILLCDPDVTSAMLARQQAYLEDCREVTLAEVNAWGWKKRLWNNAMAIVGPVL